MATVHTAAAVPMHTKAEAVAIADKVEAIGWGNLQQVLH